MDNNLTNPADQSWAAMIIRQSVEFSQEAQKDDDYEILKMQEFELPYEE